MCGCISRFAFIYFKFMKINFKAKICLFAVVWSCFLSSGVVLATDGAGAVGHVCINEVSWAGSKDSGNDEWIELYNPGNQSVDLSGWVIKDESSSYSLKGSVAANGYFVVADNLAAINPNKADLVVGLSLSNTGEPLSLVDGQNNVIDRVNSSGGAWAAGNATSRATMQRVSCSVAGDDAKNWVSYSGSGGTSVSSLGSLWLGTPGAVNVIGVVDGPSTSKVILSANADDVIVGSTIDLKVRGTGIKGLFSYGVELGYDPKVFEYVSASKGEILDGGTVSNTYFSSALSNGQVGKLVIAEARTVSEKTGVDVDGDLFSVKFKVLSASKKSSVNFADGGFISGVSGDLPVSFEGIDLIAKDSVSVGGIKDQKVTVGSKRFVLDLVWVVDGQADKYKVYRRNNGKNWILLGEVTEPKFSDSDAVKGGGRLVPGVEYEYGIVPVLNGVDGVMVTIKGNDTRGIKGDNNRSDRVDGRDLDRLAKHFGESSTDEKFDALIDTNCDGRIDGSDLVDLGSNFAMDYK